MVIFWEKELDRAIKISKYRINHHEKHGVGEATMQDKVNLKKQERKKQLRKNL